jgi:hypothetical protein
MVNTEASGLLATTAIVLLMLVILVLAANGAFSPQDGGGIHINFGR